MIIPKFTSVFVNDLEDEGQLPSYRLVEGQRDFVEVLLRVGEQSGACEETSPSLYVEACSSLQGLKVPHK